MFVLVALDCIATSAIATVTAIGTLFVCRLFGRDKTSSLSVDVDATSRSPTARCAGCDRPLDAGDVVMRVHLSVFHSTCFSCCVCRRRLSRGQQFALVDDRRIYCHADYEQTQARSAYHIMDFCDTFLNSTSYRQGVGVKSSYIHILRGALAVSLTLHALC